MTKKALLILVLSTLCLSTSVLCDDDNQDIPNEYYLRRYHRVARMLWPEEAQFKESLNQSSSGFVLRQTKVSKGLQVNFLHLKGEEEEEANIAFQLREHVRVFVFSCLSFVLGMVVQRLRQPKTTKMKQDTEQEDLHKQKNQNGLNHAEQSLPRDEPTTNASMVTQPRESTMATTNASAVTQSGLESNCVGNGAIDDVHKKIMSCVAVLECNPQLLVVPEIKVLIKYTKSLLEIQEAKNKLVISQNEVAISQNKLANSQNEVANKESSQNWVRAIWLLCASFVLSAITWLFTLRNYTTELTLSGVSERVLHWCGSLQISLAWESSTWFGLDVVAYKFLVGATGLLILVAIIFRMQYGVLFLLGLVSYLLFATSFLRLVAYYFAPFTFAIAWLLLHPGHMSWVNSQERIGYAVCIALVYAVAAGHFAALSDPLNMERQRAFIDYF